MTREERIQIIKDLLIPVKKARLIVVDKIFNPKTRKTNTKEMSNEEINDLENIGDVVVEVIHDKSQVINNLK